MTETELKYLRVLQPFFKGKMGAWQVGDVCWHRGGIIHLTDREIYSDSAQEILAEPSTLRLPLPIDPVNPERGLWGMVEGNGKHLSNHCGRENDPFRFSIEGKERWEEAKHFFGATPSEAILKALCAQEGLEVEG